MITPAHALSCFNAFGKSSKLKMNEDPSQRLRHIDLVEGIIPTGRLFCLTAEFEM